MSENRRKFRKWDLVKLRCESDDHAIVVLSDESDLRITADTGGGFCCSLTTKQTGGSGDVLLVRAVEDMMQEQPAPAPNAFPAVWDLVIADMKARDAIGAKRYGTRLQPHNGRDSLRDAYEEALDLCAYLRQAIFERDGAA